MDKQEKRERIMDEKCRKCGYSYINANVFCCDYMRIIGHSRGCSIEECQLYKEHPREPGDNKAKEYQVRSFSRRAQKRRGRKKKTDADSA